MLHTVTHEIESDLYFLIYSCYKSYTYLLLRGCSVILSLKHDSITQDQKNKTSLRNFFVFFLCVCVFFFVFSYFLGKCFCTSFVTLILLYVRIHKYHIIFQPVDRVDFNEIARYYTLFLIFLQLEDQKVLVNFLTYSDLFMVFFIRYLNLCIFNLYNW